MNVSLSFRQVNGFNFDKSVHSIMFNFFGLTTRHIPAGFNFIFRVFLIFIDGTKDTELFETVCIVNNEVNSSGEQVQADFSCEVSDLFPFFF